MSDQLRHSVESRAQPGSHRQTSESNLRPSRQQRRRHISEQLSMNRPGHQIAAGLGKAALKRHALQTLRGRRASPNRAKRLEYVRFIGAFRPALRARGSWSQCMVARPRRLSMNVVVRLTPASDSAEDFFLLLLMEERRVRVRKTRGSRSQCMRKAKGGSP